MWSHCQSSLDPAARYNIPNMSTGMIRFSSDDIESGHLADLAIVASTVLRDDVAAVIPSNALEESNSHHHDDLNITKAANNHQVSTATFSSFHDNDNVERDLRLIAVQHSDASSRRRKRRREDCELSPTYMKSVSPKRLSCDITFATTKESPTVEALLNDIAYWRSIAAGLKSVRCHYGKTEILPLENYARMTEQSLLLQLEQVTRNAFSQSSSR